MNDDTIKYFFYHCESNEAILVYMVDCFVTAFLARTVNLECDSTYRSLINFTLDSDIPCMFFYKQFRQVKSQSKTFGIGFGAISLPKSFSDMFEIFIIYTFSIIFDYESFSIQGDFYCSSLGSKFVCIIQNIFYDNLKTFFVYVVFNMCSNIRL